MMLQTRFEWPFYFAAHMLISFCSRTLLLQERGKQAYIPGQRLAYTAHFKHRLKLEKHTVVLDDEVSNTKIL